jgi:uncharacterized membrane protein
MGPTPEPRTVTFRLAFGPVVAAAGVVGLAAGSGRIAESGAFLLVAGCVATVIAVVDR